MTSVEAATQLYLTLLPLIEEVQREERVRAIEDVEQLRQVPDLDFAARMRLRRRDGVAK